MSDAKPMKTELRELRVKLAVDLIEPGKWRVCAMDHMGVGWGTGPSEQHATEQALIAFARDRSTFYFQMVSAAVV
jgi:hypothetical protein